MEFAIGKIKQNSRIYSRKPVSYTHLDVYKRQGEDSVTPFLSYEGKWVILLALTSNKGSHDFQLTEDTNGERLFEKVLDVYKRQQ